MAASGIQEHNEARRKQMHMERLAFLHKMLNDKYRSTYEAEVNDRTRINYDPLVRAASSGTNQYTPYAEMFSAKLPKRFTTTDYLMQW